VLLNATPTEQTFDLPPDLADVDFALHPEQALLSDSTQRGEAAGGVVLLPARSTTGLVAPEGSVSLAEEMTESTEVEPDLPEAAEVEPEASAAEDDRGYGSLFWLLALIPVALGAGAYILFRRRRTNG
jgi:hypothetical protein